MLHYKAAEAKLSEQFVFAWCRRGWREKKRNTN